MVQDKGDPEKENVFKFTARSRNISSHSHRLFVSHSSPHLTKHQPIKKKIQINKSSLPYPEKVNFVSAKSAMTSSLLQQPLIPNASSTLTGKVMLPSTSLETVGFLADTQMYKIHFN